MCRIRVDVWTCLPLSSLLGLVFVSRISELELAQYQILTGSPHSQTPQGWDELWQELGEPGGGKEREIRLRSVPSLREGGWGAKLGVWCPF